MLRANEKRIAVGAYVQDYGVTGRKRSNNGFLSSGLPITTNLTAWYDASVRESIVMDSGGPYGANGGYVATWKDISGNGCDLTNSLGNVYRPRYQDMGINGLGAVCFPESPAYLISTGGPLHSRPCSALAVAVNVSSRNYKALFGSQDALGLWFYINTAMHPYIVKDNTVGILYATTLTIPYARPFAVGAFLDSVANQTVVANLDGTEESTNNATALGGGEIQAGRTPGDGVYWPGMIGEIILYSDYKGSSDRATLMTYLKNKWGTA
jgi:hypothetical protein